MSAGTNRSIPTPVTVANGGTGVTTSGTTSQIAVGGGTGSPIVWTTATGTGAPVRATSPSLVTPNIGAAMATTINTITLDTSGPATIALDGNSFYLHDGQLDFYASGGAAVTINTSFEVANFGIKLNAQDQTEVTLPITGTLAARITATATLNFPLTAAGAKSDLTITLTGAAVGEAVVLGVPNGSVPANGAFFAWVSASNTITVRYANNSLLTSYDPASGSFTATIVR